MPNDDLTRNQPAVPPAPAAPAAQAPPAVPPVEEVVEGEPGDTLDATEHLTGILSNEATIVAVQEFLKAEGLSLDEVTVEEGYWNWSEGSDIARVEVGRNMEYFVSPDSDTSTRMAVALAKQSAEEGLFNESFSRSYIDEDRLRDALRDDVENQVRESPDSYGLAPEEVEEEYDEENNVTNQEEIDAAAEAGVSDEAVERKVEEILRDPIAYMQEIYGDEEGLKEAAKWGGMDYDSMAEDGVAADGEGHFLSPYDGNITDLPSGGQYWRHN